jgi:hypothetical protein
VEKKENKITVWKILRIDLKGVKMKVVDAVVGLAAVWD